jgi:hypothetical protein
MERVLGGCGMCHGVSDGETVLLAFALRSVCGERKLATERVLETIYVPKTILLDTQLSLLA